MSLNKYSAFAVLFVLSACSEDDYGQSQTSQAILTHLESTDFESIDFSTLGGQMWTKLCFLGPYNEESEKALGFDWQVAEHTAVLESDGHNVIVFATDTDVIEHVIHARGNGDFWKISGECFPREQSTLVRDKESGSWHNYVPKDA